LLTKVVLHWNRFVPCPENAFADQFLPEEAIIARILPGLGKFTDKVEHLGQDG